MTKLSEQLEAELKRRIKQDMEPKNKWDENIWKDQTLGNYYGPELFIIHLLVGGCVETVLANFNERMSDDAWAQLKVDVTTETKPPDAVEAMRKAALKPAVDLQDESFRLAVANSMEQIQLALSVLHLNSVSLEASRSMAMKLEMNPSLEIAAAANAAPAKKKAGKKAAKEKK